MSDEDYGPKNMNIDYTIPMRVLRPISEGGEQTMDYYLNMTILKGDD